MKCICVACNGSGYVTGVALSTQCGTTTKTTAKCNKCGGCGFIKQ